MERGGGLLDLLLRGQRDGRCFSGAAALGRGLLGGHFGGGRRFAVGRGFGRGLSRSLCGLLAAGRGTSGTLSAGSSRTTLSAGVSGTETAALGSAVGVWTSVFSGVCWVSLTVPSPPSTEAISSLACATELSSGFMT